MSMPVSQCLISKAGHGDENCFARLAEAMDYNRRCGHYTVLPCNHQPPCPPLTEEQAITLNKRLTEAIEERRLQTQAKHRSVDRFETRAYPITKNMRIGRKP